MSAAEDILAELASMEDPKLRAANEERGDDHGVNLSALRAVAKRLKTQHELAKELWATGDTAAGLLATLIAKPRAFSADELDAMIRDIRAPKLLDWFVNLVKLSKHAEELRLRWKDDIGLVGRAQSIQMPSNQGLTLGSSLISSAHGEALAGGGTAFFGASACAGYDA